MAMKEFNVDLDIKGKVSATDVPNSTGSIVTWNTTTNVFGLRTNAQIISDLNLSSSYITTNTTQTGLTGNKTTSGVITSTGGFVGALTGNASTATTLATSRTINGTSFNGSANITTARWGTARNITIGDTTKSVNGSANVAWSLAEIGAASSTSLNDYVPLTSLANGNRITTYPHQNYFGTTTDGKYIIIDLGQVTATMTTIEILVRQYGQTRSTTNIVISWQDNNANTSSIDNIICDNPDFYPSVSMGKSPTTGNGCIIIETSQTSLSYCSVLVKRIVNVNGLSGNITSYAVADLTGFTNVVTRTYTRDSYLLNYNNLTNKPTIPTVNNGQLTLSTGTGLSGSATFTANQSGSSTFSVAVASTHKLPTTAEWNALPTTNTITRLRGTTSGAFTSGDLTLLAGANTTITQSGANITIASTNTNTTYSAGTGLSLTGTTFANTAPNATHTGDVTGSTALTIANSAVTHAKYQNIATQRILGRGEAGTGNVQELTLGANLSLSTSGVLSSSNTTYVAGTGLSLSGNTFSVKYGTAAGTAAQGNDSRINNGQTAFGWGDFRDYGLGTNAISSGNLDIITETGFYIANTSTIGSPMAVAGIAVNHIQISSTNATQTAYRTGDTRSWFRRKSSGVWSDWVELIHTGNLNTNVSGLGFIKSADLTGYVPTSRTLTAGDGLSGGGNLTANRTITLGTPGNITLSSTNSVTSTSHTHALDSATTTAINNGNTAFGWGNYSDNSVTRSTNTNMVSTYYQGLDFDNLDAGNYAIAVASGTNVPSGIGTVRGLFRFGSSHVNLRSDIVIGSTGLAFRSSNNNEWRTVWTNSNFDPSTKQNTLIAGSNITISGNTISATNTNTTYSLMSAAELNTGTATTARTISAERLNTWLNAKGFSTQTLTAGTNITISGNTISATNTNTTYSAGAGLTLSGTTFSVPVTTSGSGNVVSSVAQSTNGITVTKGITAMTTSHAANSINQNLSTSSTPNFKSIELYAQTPYIDFHYGDSSEDYTSRIIETASGQLQNIVKSEYSVSMHGQSAKMLAINENAISLGRSNDQNFTEIYLNTFYGALEFDDIGLSYIPKDNTSPFTTRNISVLNKINDLRLNGRGSIGSPINALTGNNLSNYVLGNANGKEGLGTFRAGQTISKNGIPVFPQNGASILVQSGDTMFTLASNQSSPEIFVSSGDTTNNVIWNKKLAFSDNDFSIKATAFYEGSLRKLKENIKPFNKSGVELINSLDIVTFDRIDNKDIKDKIGIIADDTSKEFLNEDQTAVDLYKTIFIQAKAIQELEKKNQSLEERLSKLERMLENL